jgi:TatD DNase family protein
MAPAVPLANAYVDTHAHFMDGAEASAVVIVDRARAAGVRRILAPAIDLQNCETVLNAAGTFDDVFAAVGIHPNHVSASDDFSKLTELSRHARVKAIGETGLDYFRTRTDPGQQRSHLQRHMALAADRNLPIILHNRNADDDILSIARQYKGQVRGILHCFSAGIELAEQFLELGYYVSFAGNLTYPSATNLREAAARVPHDRLLTETDSPYLSPVPFRGMTNEPARVAITSAVLATCTSQDIAELTRCIDQNATRLLGW